MKLLACIKQVPDMESRFRVNGSGDWFADADLAFRMNEYDEYAVEQAVRLREQLGDAADLTVISIGPDRVVEAIKKALAMGGDRGVHVADPLAHTRDPWQIASTIAAFAKPHAFDLIFTGMQSQDRGSGQVGPMVAELLGYACTTTLVDFAYNNGTITAKRELEGGVRGMVRLHTPALVTCQLGLNTPRYPTLPNIMKARKKEIATIPIGDLLTEEPLAATAGFYAPVKASGGIVLEGDVGYMADRLLTILKEQTAGRMA